MRPFNETVRIAIDLPERVAEELETADRGDLIGITALTDPYQPAESAYRLTRQVLHQFAERGQPCLVLTKSPAILEDLVLLERIHEQSLAVVIFTLLTIDPYLVSKIEDKAPAPQLRLDAVAELKRAGIPVGVALMPILPYVNDTNYVLTTTIRAIAEAGADFVVWDHLHIPTERHRGRIGEMLTRVGNYPPGYYRDLYGSGSNATPLPDAAYRADRDREILTLCDAMNLPVRAPHQIYARRLNPRNEAALLLKHTAFRDGVQGRVHMAALHRDLAERIYRGEATSEDLQRSPLAPTLRQLLTSDAAD
jgi:DNA repair photolyase